MRILMFFIVLATTPSCTELGSVSKEGLIDFRVIDYSKKIRISVREKLELKMSDDIEILTMDVFHPVINQHEPTERKYVNKKEYVIYVKVMFKGKTTFFHIRMNSRFKIWEIREEKSWPIGVPEVRRIAN